MSQKIMTITEAAKLNRVTRQAIYVAIKLNKLKATKKTTRWSINLSDLEEYKKNKFSRDKSVFDGRPLYDKSKGEYSVKLAAKELKCTPNRIYYLVNKGRINAIKRGSAWIIFDIDKYKKAV
jgi:excisionase family DNA binding protein